MEMNDKKTREAGGAEDFERPPRTPTTSGLPNVGGETVKTVFISLVVTFVVLALMTFAGGVSFVTKKDFTANMVNMVTAVEEAEADLVKAEADVNTAIQNMPATISSQVATTTSQWTSQMSSLSDRVTTASSKVDVNTTAVNQLVSQIATLNSDVSALNTEISALEVELVDALARIEVLETELPEISPASVVTASFKSMTNVMVATDNKTLIAQFKVVITNTSKSEVEDIILEVYTETGVVQAIQSFILSGGGTIWQGQGWSAAAYTFVNNQWGLDLDAGASKTLYLTLTIKAPTADATNFLALYPNGAPYGVGVTVQ